MYVMKTKGKLRKYGDGYVSQPQFPVSPYI